MAALQIDRPTAILIMGALSTCYSEGIVDIGQFEEDADYCLVPCAENDLVRSLNSLYPDVVAQYSWLPAVEALTKEKKNE